MASVAAGRVRRRCGLPGRGVYRCAPDIVAAMAEAGRLLRPGAHYVFTTDIVPDSPDPARHVLDEHVEAAGLELLGKEVVPQFAEQLQRMYDLWVEHADEIAADVGQVVADEMVEEAPSVGPTLARRTPYLVTARRRPSSRRKTHRHGHAGGTQNDPSAKDEECMFGAGEAVKTHTVWRRGFSGHRRS